MAGDTLDQPPAATLQFWGAYTARTMRPVWTAEELGLSYRLHAIGPRTGETQTPEYRRLNPKQKVPCMTDRLDGEQITLSESLAISRYLVENYGSEQLSTPATRGEKAREDEWCCFALSELDETSLYVIRRHRDLASIYGASDTVVRSCFDYLQKQLCVVEDYLHSRSFVLDRGFGLADIMLTTCLTWAKAYGATLEPNSLAYTNRLTARPAYQRANRANTGNTRAPRFMN